MVRAESRKVELDWLQADRGATLKAQGVEQGDAEVRLPDVGSGANDGYPDRARIEQVFRFHLLSSWLTGGVKGCECALDVFRRQS